MTTPSPTLPPASGWLIRVSEVFGELADEVVRRTGASASTPLGSEYHLLKGTDLKAIQSSEAAQFIRWNLPVHHSWPCNPQKTEGFIEKAAQALVRKFGHLPLQAVLVGQLDPSSPNKYYKTLASNFRGRTLQLFPSLGKIEVEAQDPATLTLFCLVGPEGLFCGVQSPLDSNGFHPGGTRYISQNAPGTISRAGAKIAEALHYLPLHRPLPTTGGHWLELGASPGGMTSELLKRGYRVTAVDRAPLDPRLDKAKGLTFSRADVAHFQPPVGESYDAFLSDLNGSARESIGYIIRLSSHLRKGGLVVFTLKTSDASTVEAVNDLYKEVVAHAKPVGLALIATTHLTYNRQEFTLFFEKTKG
ncbi:MAG: SAM-dependent methyltransferase [Luteolibacter sp.]